jgi:hypothetical protein
MNEPRTPLTFIPQEPPPPGDPASAIPGGKARGRPRALDEAKKREICALVAAGSTVSRASRYVGCVHKTVVNEARRDREFAEKLRRAEWQAEMDPLAALKGKAKTNWRAAAFLLNRLDREQKEVSPLENFDQGCLRDFRHDFRSRLEQEVTDVKLLSRIDNTFLACYCRFTRELARMIPDLNLDFEAQNIRERKLKQQGFFP